MSDLLPGLLSDVPKRPATEKDWFELDVQITHLFSPHAPVDEEELFSGRSDLLLRMIDIIYQRGLHAILYGERGVGKTSLTYILKDKLFKGSIQTKMVRRQCTADHNFELIWRHIFDEFTVDGKTADMLIPPNPNAYDIIKLFESFPKAWRPVIIIDEFDRVKDTNTFVQMADTIKYLADTSSPVTIIIVGVAASVAELFGGHGSIHRNLQQIKMPTMSESELEKIILDRAQLAQMSIGESVRDEIVKYSQGLPGYTHMLGQAAFRSAVRRQSLDVEMPDLGVAMRRCINECDESVREAYANAVRSTQTTSLYKEALLACSLAETDEKGYFRASAIKEPFSRIVGREMDIFNFAQHLKQFCNNDRGPAIVRVGKKSNYEYRFNDALLRPYVIIKGKADGLI